MGPQDTLTNKEKAFPAANAAAYSDAIDLGEASPGNTVRYCSVLFGHPALPALAADKKATLLLQDSADGTTFAAVAELASLVTTGTTTTGGAAAASRSVRLPPNIRRHIRLSTAVENAGGDNTAAKSYLKIEY